MQAKRYLHGAVSLSTEHTGKSRAHPAWVLRYRLPSGKDSRKTLGKAWLKASRPPANFMTKVQAEAAAQRFLDEYATSLPDDRRTLRRALDDFIAHSERERKLRASTLAEFDRIANWLCARPSRQALSGATGRSTRSRWRTCCSCSPRWLTPAGTRAPSTMSAG